MSDPAIIKAAALWQPIVSAPKDGTKILVVNKNGISIAAWSRHTHGPGISGHKQLPGWVAWANGCEVADEGWDTGHGFTLELTGDSEPTHWQPLPPPPPSEGKA